MPGFDTDVVGGGGVLFATNVDFTGSSFTDGSPQVTANGQLLIGSTATPRIRVATLTPGPGVSITNGAGSITIGLTGGASAVETLTGNSGGAISPSSNNINTVGTGSITIAGSGSTLTSQLTGLTNHTVLVGAGTATITKVGPGSAAQVLQSGGAAADPAYSTATYPISTTSQQILYSTADNVIGQLTTANSKLPATNSSGTLAMRAFSVVTQVFTSASSTYTPTTGMLYCVAECVGGGGGGGGSTGGVNTQSVGGGGGGGGYSRKTISAASIGASQTITVGAAGAAGSSPGGTGGTGGTSSVGAIITATGGAGGVGGAGGDTFYASSGGVGGVGASGDFNTAGAPGGAGMAIFVTAVNQRIFSGCGGSSFFGGGGVGVITSTGDPSGIAAQSYGGGGSGSASNVNNRAGGAGFAGIVVITEYVIA